MAIIKCARLSRVNADSRRKPRQGQRNSPRSPHVRVQRRSLVLSHSNNESSGHRQRRARACARRPAVPPTATWATSFARPEIPGLPRSPDDSRRSADLEASSLDLADARAGRLDRRRTRVAAEPRRGRSFCCGRPAAARTDGRGRAPRIEQGVREGVHGPARRSDRPLSHQRRARRCARASSDRTSSGCPVVLKADGLAAGKGVVIADDSAQPPKPPSSRAMRERRFGAAGDRLVIEECLTGPEVSFFVVSDGARRAADRIGSGSQADLRRRPRTEHRRHGRVCAEPA